MASTPSKTLSPAELMKLEQAFAADPASIAYKPLAEAYLGMGRFMEAMVVCKKGVKAHPTSADPRLLLARVYAEQGKDKKALEELASALQVAPGDKNVLRMTGALQMKSGETDAGKQNLLKAFEADPQDAETQAALAEWKVEPPKPAAPEPPTEQVPVQRPAAAPIAGPGAAPMAGPGAMPPLTRPTTGAKAAPRASGVHAAPMGRPSGEKAAPRPAPVGPAVEASAPTMSGGAEVTSTPAPRPSGVRPARTGATAAASPQPITRAPSQARAAPRPAPRPVITEEEEDWDAPPKKKAGATKYIFFALVALVPVAIGATFFIGQYRARQTREFNKQLQAASEELKHDSFDSYQKAVASADKALEINPESGTAHSYLAYSWAIRWGEHGGGDEARKQAEEHLAEAKQAGETSSHLYAADALIQNYSGKGPEGLAKLRDTVKAFDAKGQQSSLLYLTLGILQMNTGDLEGARESLEKAQGLAPGDPRIYSALGSLYRRRGQDRLAWNSYDFALRYEKDHPESVLGRTLLILNQDEPAYDVAARLLKGLIEAHPPPSPRQLATAFGAKALLLSRVGRAWPTLKPDQQKAISDANGAPIDPSKIRAEIADLEDRAQKLDRQNPELSLIRGQRLLQEDNIDGAVAAFREAIKMDGSRAQFHAELAEALMRKPGGEKEARDALTTALKSMDSPKLRVMLGDVLRKLGRPDDAIAEYQKALADPKTKNPEARLALGTVYRERRAYDKAVDELQKAANEYLSQPSRAAAAYTELGRALEEKGDRAKADDAYQKALNADLEYAPAYYFYARFLSSDRAAAGKARTTAQEYLKRDPRGEYAADAQRIVSG